MNKRILNQLFKPDIHITKTNRCMRCEEEKEQLNITGDGYEITLQLCDDCVQIEAKAFVKELFQI